MKLDPLNDHFFAKTAAGNAPRAARHPIASHIEILQDPKVLFFSIDLNFLKLSKSSSAELLTVPLTQALIPPMDMLRQTKGVCTIR